MKDKRRKTRAPAPAASTEPLVNGFAARHGDYREGFMPDPETENLRTRLVSITRNEAPTIVDKWLREGGPGFEEPQRAAINHCRALWAQAGSCGRLVSHYGGMGGGDAGRERDSMSQIEAITQLAQYAIKIPRPYWSVFEMMARDGYAAGEAGERFASNDAQRQAHAKAAVGFCASMIAQWRGYWGLR